MTSPDISNVDTTCLAMYRPYRVKVTQIGCVGGSSGGSVVLFEVYVSVDTANCTTRRASLGRRITRAKLRIDYRSGYLPAYWI